MNCGKTIFSQLMDFLSPYEFRLCVQRYNGNHKIKSFSCWDQFLCMAFAQLTYRESLRDIQACLRAAQSKLYHLGIRGRVSRNTLANANQVRDWRIYADFAQILIAKARKLYANDPFGVELDHSVYALDSTTIDLCLSLFPWAQFRRRKAAVKLHTLLGSARQHPQRGHRHLRQSARCQDSGSVAHRVRSDLYHGPWLHRLRPIAFDSSGRGILCNPGQRQLPLPAAVFSTGRLSEAVRCDQIVVPRTFYAKRDYRSKLRRIRYVDPETQKPFVFLTNNFTLPAVTIAALYRCRWQVELFFKWIKQHLRIKAFYGTSENAVKTQIWIAITVYVLVAIVKKTLKLDQSLYTILQILSVTLFEKTPILQALAMTDCTNPDCYQSNQLKLFE